MIGASIAGHVALLAGVFAHGVWDLEQLGREGRVRTSLAVLVPPAAEAGPSALPEQKLPRKQREEPRRVVHEPRQPRPPREEPRIAPDTGPNVGDATGTGPGPGGDGPPGGDPCPDPGGCLSEAVPPPPADLPPPPPPPRPIDHSVTPQVLRGLRTSGDIAIRPSADVAREMQRSGNLKTSAALKVCVGVDGAVSSVGILRSTRYPAYDAALLDGVRRWVYRPYTVNGRPVPVCSVVTFQYEMR